MVNISILGIPLDLGAGRRGVDMGPSALRRAGLAANLKKLGHTVHDLGNVQMPVAETLKAESGLRYAETIAETCHQAFLKLKDTPAGVFPIALGGDHSVSLGSISGVARAGDGGEPGHERLGVIWVDAHADLNTPESSPSGNIHGMPLSHLLGSGDSGLLNIWGGGAVLNPRDLAFIGLRSLDPFERAFIHEHEIRAYSMKEIDCRGLAVIAEEVLEYLTDVPRLHISFDADALDPSIAPGVGTPVSGGLTFREAHLLMELLADSEKVTSLDLVEVNPILDIKNTTGRIMVELASSLLGKAIL